jgi:molybdenum cofactor cytidylyltransferase
LNEARSAAAVTAIVLAAGASTRMGQPKLLLEVGAIPLVRRVAEAAAGSRAGSVLVVTGDQDAAIREALGDTAPTLRNDIAGEGLASSIACGVAEADARGATAVVLLLADQPAVSAGLLDHLLDAYESGRDPVASDYEGGPGPPALFARRHYAALRALQGDRGAKALLQSEGDDVARVSFPEGALDVDTPADFARAHLLFAQRAEPVR